MGIFSWFREQPISGVPAASSRSRRVRGKQWNTRRLALECLEERCVLSTLTVDGSQVFQTIGGFGTNLNSAAWNSGAVTPSLDTLLSHGYRVFRVIVEPVQGWEDTDPNTGQYNASNPNWPYYNNLYGTSTKFTNLWNTIRYLNNHGATVWLNLQSDAPDWMTDPGGGPGTIGQDHETDWATMVSTLMNYAVNTAHVRIDALGPMNEPENAAPRGTTQGPQVDATQYVRMLDILETQLQGYGLGSISLVGPDATLVSNALDSYVPAMLADSLLMPHVMQFGFHTYGGSTVTAPDLTNNPTYPGRQIWSSEYDGVYFNEDESQRATPSQLWTQADTSFQQLIQIIGAGANGAIIWDGVDSFYQYYQQWSAHGLISYRWTAANPTAQSDYGTTPRLYANAQMFQFVAPGSVMIGSSTDAGNFIELAFKNPDGRITIVGENTGGSSQTITGTLTGGLSASLFNEYFTNSSLRETQQANVAVTNNTFTFRVPAHTIFTLTSAAPAVVTRIPATPTGLKAIPQNNQVSLFWSASARAASYNIYRGTTKRGEVLLASPTGTATTFIDSTAANGTTYYYKVTAVNSRGESPRSAEVSATPQALTNIALDGTAYSWWGLSRTTSNANRLTASGLNDNDLTNDVVLSGDGVNGQGDDSQNAYEAAGILWDTSHKVTQVTFTNGSFDANNDGVFDGNLGLQYTLNGTTWLPLTGWKLAPSYGYNSSASANVTYTFFGPAKTVRGVRVVGRVHTSAVGNNSWFARATEVQAFGV